VHNHFENCSKICVNRVKKQILKDIEIDVEQFARDIIASTSIGGKDGALGSLIKQLILLQGLDNGRITTVVDRKSKFAMIKAVTSKHAEVVTEALIEMITPVKDITHTITSDNGKEFAYHQQVSAALNTDFYFANPYHSWERGLNEHMPEQSNKYPWGTNGLIRQDLPKKSELLNISKDEILMI